MTPREEVLHDHRQDHGEREPPEARFLVTWADHASTFVDERSAPTMGTMDTTQPRGERRGVETRGSTTHRRADRAGPRRRAARWAAAVVALVTVTAALTGCVGRSGRNDDPVAPGSDGKARADVIVRPLDPRVVAAPPRATLEVRQAEL